MGKIFVAIRVPHADIPVESLVLEVEETLRTSGNVPFIAYREIEKLGLTPAQFMPYVRKEISTSNIVLVVYSPDLRGGLIELGIAYALRVPVWLAVRKGDPVSSSAQAAASKVIEYENVQDLAARLLLAISGGEDNGS